MSTRRAGPDLRETIVFAAVGAAATATYFVIAMAGTAAAFPAFAASFAAYAVATLVSYGGHRLLTFRSDAPLSDTGPRFALLAGVQYAIALALPALLSDWAGLAPSLAFGLVCVVIPVTSFVLMSRFVFRSGKEAVNG